MRLEGFATVPYALPFRERYATARGSLARREMVLLRLQTDTGIEGLGEAVPLSLRGDRPLATIEAATADAARRLIGLDLDMASRAPLEFAASTMLELAAPGRLPSPAAAALECALFDLVAKATAQPVWALLGAADAQPVACNATLTAGTPDVVAAQAREWLDAGFRTFKVKVGAGADDEAVLAAVRAAVGDGPRIRVDANEAWRPRDAIAALRRLERYGIELAEQPTSGLRGLARVARETEIPLAADESVANEADAHRAVQRRACRFATAKLAKVGGAGAARRIAGVLPTYLSSALDGPVGIAAAAHAVQIIRQDGNDPGIAHGLATQRLFAATVATRECQLRDGFLHLTDDRPGLGVEVDEAALDSHRL